MLYSYNISKIQNRYKKFNELYEFYCNDKKRQNKFRNCQNLNELWKLQLSISCENGWKRANLHEISSDWWGSIPIAFLNVCNLDGHENKKYIMKGILFMIEYLNNTEGVHQIIFLIEVNEVTFLIIYGLHIY